MRQSRHRWSTPSPTGAAASTRSCTSWSTGPTTTSPASKPRVPPTTQVMPPTRLPQQRCLRHPQHAEQIGLDLPPRVGLADLLDHPELAVTGVVDNDVEATETLVSPPEAPARWLRGTPSAHGGRRRLPWRAI